MLERFKEFCAIDLQRCELTVKEHLKVVKRFLRFVGKHPTQVTVQDIRNYLANMHG
ncbi:hypothetical protein CW703_02225 [Candidatus Bathyarchaeota archaeon]|nr:MAG: hypothetical protein CW703_02225 [Candidatus Bathyarchaeota archaeon]